MTDRIEKLTSGLLTRVLAEGPAALADAPIERLVELAQGKLRTLALSYHPDEHGGRLVAGPTGVGKSVSAVAVLRRLIRAHVVAHGFALPRVAWAKATDLANARLGHALGKGEASAVISAAKAEFLVLDDLGWESKRASGDEAVVEVLSERYDSGFITLATTGQTVSALNDRYGEAVVRRIVESGGKPGRILDLWPAEKAA